MDDRDQRIREIAYRLWEQEGYPESHADRHWAAAVAIVEEQDAEGANSNSENIAEAWEGAASSKSVSSPDAPPFVRVGERVQPGKVLCIIESMKLMNEIEAETSGIIESKLVMNGQPVEYGEALFAVRAV